ncbi:MAG: terminase [Anaerolineae bacterium]|nr:terminase [Anaerolineae bacterium]
MCSCWPGRRAARRPFGPWWLWREIRTRGPGDYLAVTATFDLFKLKMLPEMLRVFEDILRIGRYWAGERVIEICEGAEPGGRFLAERADAPMWARIILRSAKAEGGLESATANAAWLDEAGQDTFRLDSWEAVLRRLSLAQGRVLGTTTVYNLGWLKTEIYDPWRAGDPDIEVVQFESLLNPAFPRAEFERARRKLPTWKFNMFYRGQFARPAGLIYEDFDEDVHLVDPFELPAEWPRYVGIDFGAIHTALVWIAEDVRRSAYYVYRESLKGGRTTRQHVQEALQDARFERVVGWWGGSRSEKQQRWDWAQEGINVQEPPIADVEAGIDRVIQLLKERRLFVFKSCRGLLEEFNTYSRELDERGNPTEKIRDKEQFHRLDALRYAIAGITGRPGAVGAIF